MDAYTTGTGGLYIVAELIPYRCDPRRFRKYTNAAPTSATATPHAAATPTCIKAFTSLGQVDSYLCKSCYELIIS